MSEPKQEAGKGTGSVMLSVVGVAVLLIIINLTAGNIAETDFDYIEEHLTAMEEKQHKIKTLNENSRYIVNESLTAKINDAKTNLIRSKIFDVNILSESTERFSLQDVMKEFDETKDTKVFYSFYSHQLTRLIQGKDKEMGYKSKYNNVTKEIEVQTVNSNFKAKLSCMVWGKKKVAPPKLA